MPITLTTGTTGTKREDRAIYIPRFLALGKEPELLIWIGPFKIYSWNRWLDVEKNEEVNPLEAYPPYIRRAVACSLAEVSNTQEHLRNAVLVTVSALESESDSEIRIFLSHSAVSVISQICQVYYEIYPDQLSGCPCCMKDAPPEFVVPKLLLLAQSAIATLRDQLSAALGSERRAACESIGRLLNQRTTHLLLCTLQKTLLDEGRPDLKCIQSGHGSDSETCAWRNPIQCVFSVAEAFRCDLCSEIRKHPLLSELRQGVESILHSLGDPDQQVRVAACEALSRIGEDYIVDLLIGQLINPNRLVQETAVIALGMIGIPRAIHGLEQFIKSEATDESLRQLARRTLEQVPRIDKGIMPHLPELDISWVPARIERSQNYHKWAQALRTAIVQGKLEAIPEAPLDEVERLLQLWKARDYEAASRETPAVFRKLVELGDEELLYSVWLLYVSHWAGVFDEQMAKNNPQLAMNSCIAGERVGNALGDKSCTAFFAKRRRQLEQTYGVKAEG